MFYKLYKESIDYESTSQYRDKSTHEGRHIDSCNEAITPDGVTTIGEIVDGWQWFETDQEAMNYFNIEKIV